MDKLFVTREEAEQMGGVPPGVYVIGDAPQQDTLHGYNAWRAAERDRIARESAGGQDATADVPKN